MTKKKIKDMTASKLSDAIKNLEAFAEQNEQAEMLLVNDLEMMEGHLVAAPKTTIKNTIDLIHCLFSDKSREEQFKKKSIVQHEILKSIDYLKSHYFMLEKFQTGTEAQKKLAGLAKDVINRYNAVIEHAKHPPETWGKRFARFLFQQSGLTLDDEIVHNPINLPTPLAQHFTHFTSMKAVAGQMSKHKVSALSDSDEFSRKISGFASYMQNKASTTYTPTPQEADAFRMKAISMLQNPTYSSLVRDAMVKTPIQTTIDSQNSKESEMIVSLRQVITPFPGEQLVITGSFLRKQSAHVTSVPITDSFHLSTHSTQTGFPHPLQHVGWALAHPLIPSYPHRLDLLPLFSPVYKQKQEVSHALLPKGTLIERAREIFKLKKEAFKENHCAYLGLLSTLSKAIAEAADHPGYEDIINRFYTIAETRKDAYEFVSQVHDTINQYFIINPYNKLYEEWGDDHRDLEGALAIYNADVELTQHRLTEELLNSQNPQDQTILKYTLLMGEILGPPARTIIFQYLSEKIKCAPPMLVLFEQLVQTAVYSQLLSFYNELQLNLEMDRSHNLSIMHTYLKREIQSSIALFKTKTIDDLSTNASAITNELEVYYNSRFYEDASKKS